MTELFRDPCKSVSSVLSVVRFVLQAYFFLAVRSARAEELAATAARTNCMKAASLIFSPSRRSIARRVFPARVELKSFFGSWREAPASEGELHHLFVRFPCANDSVMRPDWSPHPFPLFLDVGIGLVNEPADMGERLASPVVKFFDLGVDECRGRFRRSASGAMCWFFRLTDSDGLFHIKFQFWRLFNSELISATDAPNDILRHPSAERLAACPSNLLRIQRVMQLLVATRYRWSIRLSAEKRFLTES
jgi:hypothetical protein